MAGESYDYVSGKWITLPEGWGENQTGYVREDGKARCVITGPHGRWIVERNPRGRGWRAFRGRNRRPLYFKNLLSAIARVEES